jgi:NifB/MoaA-like Fe-S oxidoreductase
LKAGLAIPEEESYEGYPQLDNGVGLIRSMDTEIEEALLDLSAEQDPKLGDYSVATGYAAFEFLSDVVDRLNHKLPGTQGRVYRVRNDFFGDQITVAGLLTGRDLVRQLSGKELGKRLFLPYVMLRHERDRFLDDMTPAQVEEALGVSVVFSECNGYDFVEKVLAPTAPICTDRKDGR